MFECRKLLWHVVLYTVVAAVMGGRRTTPTFSTLSGFDTTAIEAFEIVGQLQPAQAYLGFNNPQPVPGHTAVVATEIGGNCLPRHERRPFGEVTKIERAQILHLHNSFRDAVAGNRTDQPQASNMRQMIWDGELAGIAQRWADQCRFQHDCPDCRRVGAQVVSAAPVTTAGGIVIPAATGTPTGTVGQNLFLEVGPGSQRSKNDWEGVIKSWFDERFLFNDDFFPLNPPGQPTNNNNPPTPPTPQNPARSTSPRTRVEKIQNFQFDFRTGHYTQMVWADTDRIGCGFKSFRQGGKDNVHKLYVCNYGDSGNFINLPVYSIGFGCDNCPAGFSCSATYPSLCELPKRFRQQFRDRF